MKVIFFGTPDIAANVLKYLLEHNVNIVAVVTKPDRPKGRSLTPVPTPVKVAALEYSSSIPIYQPEFVSVQEFVPNLEQYEADLFVVVAYGEIMKQHLLDMPFLGCINLHASLLPKYRGAAPIQRCIMEGDTVGGISIMHMVKKMDAGDVIKVVSVNIEPNMSAGELTDEYARVGREALLDVIHDFESGNVKSFPQDTEKVTFAPKIELEDCELKWSLDAQKLHNLVRGVNPEPGSFCYVMVKGEKKRLKIKATRIEIAKGEPGEILSADKEGIVVACGSNALKIIDLQLEGKKNMSIGEFLCGTPANLITFLNNEIL
jgi:methionyl-tRNA formyltransferase